MKPTAEKPIGIVSFPDIRTKTDIERATSLSMAPIEKSIGRAKMQSSLILSSSKIISRFQAVCLRFGYYSEITRIFANRLLEILPEGDTHRKHFIDGVSSRIGGNDIFLEDFTDHIDSAVLSNLFRLGWVMADLEIISRENSEEEYEMEVDACEG